MGTVSVIGVVGGGDGGDGGGDGAVATGLARAGDRAARPGIALRACRDNSNLDADSDTWVRAQRSSGWHGPKWYCGLKHPGCPQRCGIQSCDEWSCPCVGGAALLP